jgi:branched-chain amino acid transport system ATP-binding protein
VTALLEAKNLTIRFGGVVAADDVSLVVQQGEILAIIGPNGAGKTTFLNICTGYLSPSGGSVYFEGRDITRMAPRRITKLGIARAFQVPQLFLEQTVIENLLLAITARRNSWSAVRPLGDPGAREEAKAILDQLGVAHHGTRAANELSEGTRKLVDIAVALALNPRLLLMDEPTSGVASAEKFALMDVVVSALTARGVSSVFVEHDMDMVTRYADRVAVWSGGRIQKDGPPQDILSDPEVRRTVIGQ